MKINFIHKYLILILLLFSTLAYSQVIETGDNDDNFFKIYSLDVKYINNFKDTKEFIKDLESNLFLYVKDDKLENKFFNFYYNGNYKGIKYLSHYLISRINNKSLALSQKDKVKICNLLKKYDEESPIGDNCIGNLNYKNSKIIIWKYLIPYIKAYIKYIQNGENIALFFYSTFYFLLFFSIVIILMSFIISSILFIKDIYSLIFIKREGYESFFWAISLFLLGIYLISFNLLLLLLIIITLSFGYLKNKFIPLFIAFLFIPFIINILIDEYNDYDMNISENDKLAFEIIHTDMLPNKEQLFVLKNNKSFFSNIALAYYYKSNSKFNIALKYYKDALKIKKMGFIYNNMGNIYSLLGDKNKAISSYNEAKYYGDEVVYFYNLSKLYYRYKDKDRAEYSRKLANNIDKQLVRKFDKISSFNSNRFFIDKLLGYKECLKIYSKISTLEKKDKYLDQFRVSNKKYFINLLISILFYIFLIFSFRRKLSAAYCQRCGTIFNNLDISVKHKSFDLCSQCHSMMNTRSSLKREDLMKKEKQIRSRKKLIKIRDYILNAFLPGSFLFYKYSSYLGVFFILWHSYYIVSVLLFYSKWKLIVNVNFFNFSSILFGLIELSVYIYTYYKLKTRS